VASAKQVQHTWSITSLKNTKARVTSQYQRHSLQNFGRFTYGVHRFYYADEREADGNPTYSDINGPAHAEFYTALAEGKTQQSWLATFVKGKGYVDFQEFKMQEKGALKEEPKYVPVAQ